MKRLWDELAAFYGAPVLVTSLALGLGSGLLLYAGDPEGAFAAMLLAQTLLVLRFLWRVMR